MIHSTVARRPRPDGRRNCASKIRSATGSVTLLLAPAPMTTAPAAAQKSARASASRRPNCFASQGMFGKIRIDGLNIACREPGDRRLPRLVVLHGFPSSSDRYRDPNIAPSVRSRVLADVRGFGDGNVRVPAIRAGTFDRTPRSSIFSWWPGTSIAPPPRGDAEPVRLDPTTDRSFGVNCPVFGNNDLRPMPIIMLRQSLDRTGSNSGDPPP